MNLLIFLLLENLLQLEWNVQRETVVYNHPDFLSLIRREIYGHVMTITKPLLEELAMLHWYRLSKIKIVKSKRLYLENKALLTPSWKSQNVFENYTIFWIFCKQTARNANKIYEHKKNVYFSNTYWNNQLGARSVLFQDIAFYFWQFWSWTRCSTDLMTS